jgi:hypothetical protein
MVKKVVEKVAKAAKKAPAVKSAETPREVKLTEHEEKLLAIVREAKSEGIQVGAAAKKLYGSKVGDVARPNQAIFFKVISLNKKLKALGQKTIEKVNPGAGPGKQITLILSKAA